MAAVWGVAAAARSNSLSPRPEMRPRDGGLVAQGVGAMRVDEAGRRSGCCGSGQQAVSFKF